MTDINNNPDELRSYLAAELLCAAIEHKLIAADLGAVRLALLGGLISAAQAIGHIEATDRFRFLGRLPGKFGPEWAESAHEYNEQRRQNQNLRKGNEP
jgi:hypothetical protein